MTIRAVTFDVTHTLIHSPRVPEIYAEVLTRHGLETSAAAVRRHLPVVWQEFSCRTETGRDRFSIHPEGARGWWRELLGRLAAYLELPEPSRFAAAELYHRFARADAWEVYPDVRATLGRLREQGLSLAVISNWDERLGPLLTRLDLIDPFDAVVFSADLGVEKPDPRIFQHALELLGAAPEEALHVGDQEREDVEGAHAAGMHALHLLRRKPPGGAQGEVETLGKLPDLIETGAPERASRLG